MRESSSQIFSKQVGDWSESPGIPDSHGSGRGFYRAEVICSEKHSSSNTFMSGHCGSPSLEGLNVVIVKGTVIQEKICSGCRGRAPSAATIINICLRW